MFSFAKYTEDDLKSDWFSPVNDQQSLDILKYGSLATFALIATRKDTVEPFQKNVSESKPLGDLSHFGDLMGQLIPNAIYMGGMYYHGKTYSNQESLRRSKLMFKTSLFSGMTTFFLKRAINQRRPNKGDRNSFPSGHTTTAFAFASVVSLEHKKWSIPAYLLASIVGFSRINDDAHYLHDVFMGATIGMAYGYALHKKSMENLSFVPVNDGYSVRWVTKF